MEEHVSIKVMRLQKPEFFQEKPVVVIEKKDYLGGVSPIIRQKIPSRPSIVDDVKKKKTTSTFLTGLSFTDSWVLPNTTSNAKIFVGETFSCYICFNNHSLFSLRNVIIRIELEVGKKKTKLLDISNAPIANFQSFSIKDYIIDHPLSMEGDHSLLVTVQYNIENEEESKTLKKKFSFNVINPLSMKGVKMYNLYDNIFVRLDLMNVTNKVFFVESLTLEPSAEFKLKDHSTQAKYIRYEQPLLPHETRRYLFELIPKNEKKPQKIEKKVDIIDKKKDEKESEKVVEKQTVLGRISLNWKGKMGENGMLVTNSINLSNIQKPEIDLKIVEIKNKNCESSNIIKIEEEIEITFNIINRTDKSADITISFSPDEMFPICVSGNSLLKIGKIGSFSETQEKISFFSLASGIHSIGNGIILKNSATGKKYKIGELAKIFCCK